MASHPRSAAYEGCGALKRIDFCARREAEVHTTAGEYTRYWFPDTSEVLIRPNGEVVRLPQREYGPQGQRTNRGVRLDENGAPTFTDSTGERVED